MTTLIWVELANQRWGDVSRTPCFTHALVAGSVILGNEKQTEKMGCLFLLKIMAYQMPFQDLHLNQLKAFGSSAQNAASQVELVNTGAKYNNNESGPDYKGLCDEQK